MAPMIPSDLKRLIDANLNRSVEGLRVLEDIARFIFNDSKLTGRIRDIRHLISERDIEFDKKLIGARDVAGDVGLELPENKTRSLPQVIVANAHRVQESLRVLEEFAKSKEIGIDSEVFKNARFFAYEMEKELLGRVLRKDKKEALKGLYIIIDGTKGLSEEIASGVVGALEFDDTGLSDREFLALAKKTALDCRGRNILFIIKSRLDIALASMADGLIVGDQDLPVEEARALMPLDMLLGVMTNNLDALRRAKDKGSDFGLLGFGPDLVDKVALGGIKEDFPTVIKNVPSDNIKSLFLQGIMIAVSQQELSPDLIKCLQETGHAG